MIHNIFENQVKFQSKLNAIYDVVSDNPILFANSMLFMIEELGEVLKEDKRWKNVIRNKKYSSENKKEELCDVFIIMLNLLIFSGIDIDEFLVSVIEKQKINFERLVRELNEGESN